MAVLRVAHVWGDRLLDVQHLGGGTGEAGPLRVIDDRIELDGKPIALEPGKQLDVPFGATALRLTWVERQPKASPVAEDSDWGFTKLVACMVLLSSAAIAMFNIQVGLGLADDDSLSRSAITYRKILPELPPPKKLKLDHAAVAAKTDAPREEVPAKSSGRRAPLKAKNAGLLGILDSLDDAKALFAPGGMSPGVMAALDKLEGDRKIGDAQGFGGSRGPGNGNGNGLGLSGNGFTRRVGGPLTNLDKKDGGGPCCEATKVTDGLSKEVIAKVIRRHFSEIKFCYEQALQQKPELAGKLLVLFVIDGTGAVSEATVAEATLEDPNVESCVLARIRRWRFPEPNGGGVVSVTHPWFFKPAGDM